MKWSGNASMRLRKLYGLFLLFAQTAGLLLDLRRMHHVRQGLATLARATATAERAAKLALTPTERHRLDRLEQQRQSLLAFRKEALISLAKHALDHVVAVMLIRGAAGIPWNNLVVGSAGTATSLIQLWQLHKTSSTSVPLADRLAVERFRLPL